MKGILNSMEFNIKSFKEYIKKNKFVFAIGILILLGIYGKQLYVINCRIDTEPLINNPKSVFNWLDIGRQGGIFTRILFDQLNFNPYFETIISFLGYIISMIFFGYLFKCLGNISAKISILIFLIFLVHPIWVEQMYFTMMVLQISIALFITAFSILLCFWGIIDNKIMIKILSIVLMVWLFSTYQSFVILYIACTVFSYIIFYNNISIKAREKYTESKLYIQIILEIIILFAIALVINSCITRLFFSDSVGYLQDQIMWGKEPIKNCIYIIMNNIKDIILGNGIFYSYSYIISSVLMISVLVYNVLFTENIKLKWLYILAGIGFQLCPFILTIYGAAVPAYRSQFVLPFVIACNIGFLINNVKRRKCFKVISIAIGLIVFVSQVQIVLRMQYTDDIRFQEDMRIGNNIFNIIDKVTNGENKPIAFVGSRSPELNASCIDGELIGKSIFNYDGWVKPYYWWSSERINSLLRTMGFNSKNVSQEQMLKAREIAYTLPNWPNENSIYDAGEFVIVKLSQDDLYVDDNIMGSSIKKVEIDNLNFSNKLNWAIDENFIQNGILKIRGWLLDPNLSSNNSTINVYIENEENGTIFKLTTIIQKRNDVDNAFNSDYNYTNCGFMATGIVDNFDGDLSNYKIILEYRNNEKSIFVDTNCFVDK